MLIWVEIVTLAPLFLPLITSCLAIQRVTFIVLKSRSEHCGLEKIMTNMEKVSHVAAGCQGDFGAERNLQDCRGESAKSKRPTLKARMLASTGLKN